MANSEITLHGRLTDAPELRFTPQGTAVANATIAVSERTKNAAGEWEEGEASFINVIAWQQMAEAITEAGLGKGDLVLATGTLKVRKWETKEGKKGITPEVTLSDIGKSLKWLDKKSKPSNKTGTTVHDTGEEPPF